MKIPPGVLQPGEIYRCQVRVYDGASWSSGNNYSRSERWYFTAGDEPLRTSVPAFSGWGVMMLFAAFIGAGWIEVRRNKAT